MKKAAAVAVAVGGTLVVHAQADANVTAVTNGVSTLAAVFGTVFALGVAVVIAMIARMFRRRTPVTLKTATGV